MLKDKLDHHWFRQALETKWMKSSKIQKMSSKCENKCAVTQNEWMYPCYLQDRVFCFRTHSWNIALAHSFNLEHITSIVRPFADCSNTLSCISAELEKSCEKNCARRTRNDAYNTEHECGMEKYTGTVLHLKTLQLDYSPLRLPCAFKWRSYCLSAFVTFAGEILDWSLSSRVW